MAAGLQVFDSSGINILDTSSRITKFLGSIDIDVNGTSGSITDHRLLQGNPFHIVVTLQDVGMYAAPNVYFNGSNINYSSANLSHSDGSGGQVAGIACKVFYGIY